MPRLLPRRVSHTTSVLLKPSEVSRGSVERSEGRGTHHAESSPLGYRDRCFTSQLETGLHVPILEGRFMRKALLVFLCAGLLSEVALPPLVAQSSMKYSSSRRRSSSTRSRRSRRARNVAIGAAGGAAGGAILGRGRGAGAGAVIGGTAGALTPTRRRR